MDVKSVATFVKGRMNKSIDERLVPQGEYIDALNVRLGATETTEVGAVENSKGNDQLTELRFASILLSSQARCIGAYDDGMNETMYWFVHDPAHPQSGVTGIVDLVVSLNTITNIVNYHVESTSVLNFDEKFLITGVDLIDNLLFWTDDKNPPRKIDVRRNYPTPVAGIDIIVEEDISVVRKPPGFQVLDTITAPLIRLIRIPNEENYLEDKFISFAYRYRYEDQEYSATSLFTTPAFQPGPFEFDYSNFYNGSMQNKFNGAEVSFNTGSKRVIAIDVLYKFSNSTTIFLIERFDKLNQGWPDNTTHTITFSNSKIYTVLGSDEILRLYDNVPRIAKAQTIMANRLVYGNYVDGYNITNAGGQILDIEYYLKTISVPVGLFRLPFPVLSNGIPYQINFTVSTTAIQQCVATFDLATIADKLLSGSQFVLSLTIQTIVVQAYAENNTTGARTQCTSDNTPSNGCTGWEQSNVVTSFEIECFVDLTESYTGTSAVSDFVASTDFAKAIGTIAPPATGANFEPLLTSEDGFSLTDSFNSLTIAPTAYVKTNSSINSSGNLQGILITPPSTASGTEFSLQLIAMEYVFNNVGTGFTIHSFEYFTIIDANADFTNVINQGSLHSNRDYEVGLVYMDEYARASTVLVSQFNTEFIPPADSDLLNSIQVELFSSPPSWAKRWKYVMKPSATNYETIYSNYFVKALDGSVWLLLRGDNSEKVKNGDVLIVKVDADGATNQEIKTEILAAEAQGINFIDPRPDPADSTVKSPAGYYINVIPNLWRVSDDVIPNFWSDSKFTITNSGASCTKVSTQKWFYDSEYTQGGNVGALVNIPINAGSQITITLRVWRGEGGSGTEPVEYNYSQTFTASQNFLDLHKWWQASQPDLGSGVNTASGNYNDVFFKSEVATFEVQAGMTCTLAPIYVPPCRDTAQPMSLGANGNCEQQGWFGNVQFAATDSTVAGSPLFLQFRQGLSGTAKRAARSVLTVEVVQGSGLLVFETEAREANSELFYDASTSYPIINGQHASGNEVSNGTITSLGANQLNDSAGIFSVTIQVGDFIYNTTTGLTAGVTVVNSNILLTISANIFLVVGDTYVIIRNTNNTDQNQTAAGEPSVLTLPFINCYSFGNGVESFKILDRLEGMSMNLGERVLAVSNQDFKEANRFAGLTYSGIFSGESNQNNLNEFNLGLVNFKDCETSFGEIQVLHARRTDILVLQEDRISYVLAGKNILTDAIGGGTVTSVPQVLGEQVARIEEYGNSFNPESFSVWGFDMYFTDTKRGAVIKLTGSAPGNDQLTVISNEGMRSWFRDQFFEQLLTQKLGGFDPYMNEYVLSTNDIKVPFPDPPVPCGTILSDIQCKGTVSYTVDVGDVIGIVLVQFTVFGGNGTVTAVWNQISQSITSSGNGVYTITIDKTTSSPTTVSIEIVPNGILNYELVVICPTEQTLTLVQVGINASEDVGKLIHCMVGWTNATTESPLLNNQMVFNSDPTVASLYYSEQGVRSIGYFPYDGANLVVQTNKIAPDNYDFDINSDKLRWYSSNVAYGNTPEGINNLLLQSLNTLTVTQVGTTNVFRGIQNNASIPIGNQFLYIIYDLQTVSDQFLCYSSLSPVDACCNCVIPCIAINMTEPQTNPTSACNLLKSITYYFIGQGANPVIGDLLFTALGCGPENTATAGYYGFTQSGSALARYMIVNNLGVITNIINC
jgi:hypothetical protein